MSNILASIWPFSKMYAAGYDAAERSNRQRRLDWGRQVGKDEDSMIGASDRNELRVRCRNLQRNDPITAGIIERFADNVVGSGIKPQAKTSDPKWNDEAEAFWEEWSKVADLRQRVHLSDFQKLIISERIVSGDIGFVLTSGGQLQPIESERIATPEKLKKQGNVVEGVKIDPKTGLALGYYVFGRDENGMVSTSGNNWDFVPRENFIFCMKPKRPDQVRGVPDLAPVITSIEYVQEIQRATLEKANMDAYKAWFIGTENGIGPGNLGARNSSKGVDDRTYEKQLSGQTIYGRPGDRVESLASNTPNPQYIAFLQNSLRIIGSAFGLPYEFMLLDFSQGNYAVSRAALLQTHRTFTNWQTWETAPLQRIWNWRIAKAIKEKALPPAPIGANGISEWYKIEWSLPEFGWVDPQSEAQANLLEWQMSTNTVTQMCRKKGRDVEDVMREKGKELALAQTVADEVNKTMGTSLTWRDIISAQIPGQTSAATPSISVDDEPAEDEPAEDEETNNDEGADETR